MKWFLPLLGCALIVISETVSASPLLDLTDHDRVVFVGSALVELDQQQGYFEALLDARFPSANFTFRNLGWSGDDVWGNARAEFGSQADGYKKLIDEVLAAKPTVLLINYGNNESFAGEAGLSAFLKQYEILLNDLAKTGAKVWLIGPSKLEDLGRPLPDPAKHNDDVKRYNDAIRALAARGGAGFVDLMPLKAEAGKHLTTDEMHFTDSGAKQFARLMAGTLWGDVSALASLESIRLKTIQKNREFFYRWRPQNDTYIFGFRKHEQGQNAVEIPQFDPIVRKLEAEITELKKKLAK